MFTIIICWGKNVHSLWCWCTWSVMEVSGTNWCCNLRSDLSPGDYGSIAAEICFPPGTSEQTVVVPILNDDIHEPTESFLARLSLPAGQTGVLLNQDTTTVTIEDDDGKIHSMSQSFTNPSEGIVYSTVYTCSSILNLESCVCFMVRCARLSKWLMFWMIGIIGCVSEAKGLHFGGVALLWEVISTQICFPICVTAELWLLKSTSKIFSVWIR